MKLAICTPSPGRVSVAHKLCFADICLLAQERGVEVLPIDDCIPGNLPRSRNQMAYRVASELEPDDWSFWVDADVSFDGRLLFDAWSTEEDVWMRGYPRRNRPGEPFLWSVDLLRNGSKPIWNEERTMLEVASSGWGWTMVRAKVFQQAAEKYGVRGAGGRGVKTIPLFCDDWLDPSGTECGEDVSAFYRLREMGVRCWVNPTGTIQNGDLSACYYDTLVATGQVS